MYSSFTVQLNAQDIGAKIRQGSLTIQTLLNNEPDTCSLTLVDPSAEPQEGQQVIISGDGSTIFGGIVMRVNPFFIKGDIRGFVVECQDYEAVLNRTRVAAVYANQTCKAIIEDIITNYVNAAWGFTTVGVETGPTIESIDFDYMTPAECIRKICNETGYSFYVDYDRDINFFAGAHSAAPRNIGDGDAWYWGLVFNPDMTQIRNKVTVIGGMFQSPPVDETFAGDDATTDFVTNYRPHSPIADENGTAKTIGILNIHDPASFNYLMDFNSKTFTRSAGALPSGTTLTINYKYDVRAIVEIEDAAAQAAVAIIEGEGDGIYESAIRDESITSLEEATRRGQTEVENYGYPQVPASFITDEDGFSPGQEININLTGGRHNGTYLIKSVTKAHKGGGLFVYTVQLDYHKMKIEDMIVELFRKADQAIKASQTAIDLVTYLNEEIEIDDSSLTVTERNITASPYLWDGNSQWGFAQWQ